MAQTLESSPSMPDSGLARARPAASWPAIIAGAFVAAGVSLILIALGSGLGFASVSPWPGRGESATTFTVTMAIWLIVTQWIAASVGGYIAGRLRTRWVGTHAHEIFFRDTAHGLVTWAVATVLLTAAVATSVISAIGGALHRASDVVAAGTQEAVSMTSSPSTAYGIDRLFRSTRPGAGGMQAASDPGAASDPRSEVAHIMVHAMTAGSVSDADRSYLADLVAARTGISQEDAKKRVDDFVAGATEAEAKLKAAADTARRAAARASIYIALSLLVGAFIASVSAALGGRLRDEHP